MKELELEEQAASAKKDKKKKKKAKARDSAPVFAAEHQDASANAEDSAAAAAVAAVAEAEAEAAVSKERPDDVSKKPLWANEADSRQREETPAAAVERSQAVHVGQPWRSSAAANAEEPPPEHGETQMDETECMPPPTHGGSGVCGGEAQCERAAAAGGECAGGKLDGDNASGSRAHQDMAPSDADEALRLSEGEEVRDSEPLQNARQGQRGSAAARGKGAWGRGWRGEAACGVAAGD